ncbi:MAG: tol-pal system protein YbgF [Deltaproteobacteria bacterium]|nr:tol-pal system protein YbgF [Deltaproteobacteria bacterium]
MRPGVFAIGLLALVGVAACAHRPANQVEIDQLNRSIEALRMQNASYAKQVEELENRIFILSDRLESQQINEERTEAPRLPTVALHPTPPAPAAVSQIPSGTETAVEPEVEYVGEAAKHSERRPVLRLHGDSGELTVPRRATGSPATIRVLREGTPRTHKEDRPEILALYREALAALQVGKHEEAAQGFREFLQSYPGHDLADNSQYWLGECFYDRKDYAQAVREFRQVIEHYPNGNKVPDALLKVGFSYLALGSPEAGRQTLAQLQRSYPRHEAAVLAASRLIEMDRPSSVRSAGDSARAAAPAAKGAHASEEAP